MSVWSDETPTVSSSGAWHDRAACRRADPALFFGEHRERPGARRRRENAAREVCNTCPVQRVCAAAALAGQERNGLWGGLGEHDRAALWLHLGVTVPGVTEMAADMSPDQLDIAAEQAARHATADEEVVAQLTVRNAGTAPLLRLYDRELRLAADL